ncbi:DUF5990 family protein [Nocardia sp. NPDC051030]|uniref:DUF5990 family protein n=1 Tax=Nocardia sp. NPDC051030 TaxID=3155162 RepID=UPI003422AF68
MLLRIEGHNLPGATCPPSPDLPGYANIHVGVQRKDRPGELLELQRGDAASVAWSLECKAVEGPAGLTLRGPYIQNRGGSFVYLSWGEVDAEGGFHMFRRAKLWLDAVDPDVMAAAIDAGMLVARLDMTDVKGNPVCASLRPPRLELSVPAP